MSHYSSHQQIQQKFLVIQYAVCVCMNEWMNEWVEINKYKQTKQKKNDFETNKKNCCYMSLSCRRVYGNMNLSNF